MQMGSFFYFFSRSCMCFKNQNLAEKWMNFYKRYPKICNITEKSVYTTENSLNFMEKYIVKYTVPA